MTQQLSALPAAAFPIRDRNIQPRNHAMNYQVQAPPPNNGKALPRGDRIAVLLAGYGEVQSYRDLSRYDRAATKYIAAQFIPILEWLYPLTGVIERGIQHLLIYPLLVVDSAFTGAIAVEQVNEAIAAASQKDSHHSPFKSVRYISSFATEPAYIDLIGHQLEEALAQPCVNHFFESQIGIILVVHGGPEKAKGLLTGVIDGQALCDGVRSQLQARYPLMSIGWIDHDMPFVNWLQPDLRQAMLSAQPIQPIQPIPLVSHGLAKTKTLPSKSSV